MGGGAYGNGTAFTITSDAAEKVLYGFRGRPEGGARDANLVNEGGILYGTTTGGGPYNNRGTVFSISTSGIKNVVHRFGRSPDYHYPARA